MTANHLPSTQELADQLLSRQNPETYQYTHNWYEALQMALRDLMAVAKQKWQADISEQCWNIYGFDPDGDRYEYDHEFIRDAIGNGILGVLIEFWGTDLLDKQVSDFKAHFKALEDDLRAQRLKSKSSAK